MSQVADDIRVMVALGGPLTVSRLAAALDADPDVVLAACDDLASSGLIADRPDGVVIAGPDPDIGNARRTLFAGRLAAVLSTTDISAERLGRLHVLAGQPRQALPLLAEAAADPSTGHPEAIELLTLALDSAPPDTPQDDIGALLLARSRRHRDSGRTALAVADATAAISHVSGETRIDVLALASVLADDLQHPQEAERWAAMALLEAGRLGSHPKFGSLRSLHARELARLGFAKEAAVEQAAGRAVAAAVGTEIQQFYTLVNAARTELDIGDVRAARASYQHLRDVSSRLEGPVTVAAVEAHLARALLLGGDVSAGLECVDRARAIAESTGSAAVAFLADIALAEGLLAFHRHEEALAVSERLIETATRALPAWKNRASGYRAAALIGLRRLDEAHEEIERALAVTPRGGDGLRLRLWLRCRAIAVRPGGWDQREAENLTDLLVQSGWLQTAAELMLIRAAREKQPQLASEAVAMAYRLGQPMLAADALETGKLWSTSSAAVIADRLREVERTLPEDWLQAWLEHPSIQSGLSVDVRDDGRAAEELRLEVERVLGGLDSAAALSPAQRVARGAVRRMRKARTVGRTLLEGAAAAALALAIVLAVVVPGDLTDHVIELPDGGLSGAAPFAGGPTRAGVVEASVGKPEGVYWEPLAFGGSFQAAPVVFGNSLFVGSSEGRFYSIDLERGTRTFEETVEGSIDVAATVSQVAGFGEGGQSTTLAFFGATDGSMIARNLGDTGEVVWRFTTGGRISGPPIVVDRTVYFASSDGHVYGVDGAGGFEMMRFPEQPVAGGFTEALAADDSYLYAVGGGDLYMLHLGTLELECVVDLAARAEVVTHPVVADGAVYVGTSLQTISVFEPGNCGAPPPGLLPSHQVGVSVNHAPVVHEGFMWLAADELLLRMNVASIDLEVVDVEGVITSSPVMAGGSLIMAIEGGRLIAVDARSRTVTWTVDIGSEIRAPVAIVDDVIVVASERGDLMALGG